MNPTPKHTPLHQDDGLAGTRVPGESLADIELQVLSHFLVTRGKVLDLGCGKGRLGQYIGQAGFETVGVELDIETIKQAHRVDLGQNTGNRLILADGRDLCFRSESFEYVVSLASTLSEKHRLWLTRRGRAIMVKEAVRVTKPGGLIIVNFVHRYWSLKSFLSFFKHYWMWLREKVTGKKTEFGDYIEKIGQTPIRFHAFTIREAKSLFPRNSTSLSIWKKGGFFTDWFFVVAKKRSALRG